MDFDTRKSHRSAIPPRTVDILMPKVTEQKSANQQRGGVIHEKSSPLVGLGNHLEHYGSWNTGEHNSAVNAIRRRKLKKRYLGLTKDEWVSVLISAVTAIATTAVTRAIAHWLSLW